MKNAKWLAALVMLTVLIFQAAPARADITGLRTEPPELTIGQGQVETMLLWVDNVKDLVGFEIHLSYDPEVVEVVDQSLDQPGIQVGAGALTSYMRFAQNIVDNNQGTMDFVAVQQGASHPVSGSGGLLVIPFRGLSLGVSAMVYLDSATITVLVNGNQVSDSYSWTSGMITIVQPKAASATPRPTNTAAAGAALTPTVSSSGYPVSTSTGDLNGYPLSTSTGNSTPITSGYPPGTGGGLTATTALVNGGPTADHQSRLASPTPTGRSSSARTTVTVTPILGPAHLTATHTPIPNRTPLSSKESGTPQALTPPSGGFGQNQAPPPSAAQIWMWVLIVAGVVGLAAAAGSLVLHRARHAADDDLLL
jgi:hypothetical protein